ncbi:MAG: hypothetical protein WD512_16955 [Candidatus Paceibacterota bacterium]
MFLAYAPEHGYTPEQMKNHDNCYILSLCSYWGDDDRSGRSLYDHIYGSGDNLEISLVRDEDKKLVAVKLENCTNNSFKNWIKYGEESYAYAKEDGTTYTLFFNVHPNQYDRFDTIYNKLYPPPPSSLPESVMNTWCILL